MYATQHDDCFDLCQKKRAQHRATESCYTRGIQNLECPSFILNRSC